MGPERQLAPWHVPLRNSALILGDKTRAVTIATLVCDFCNFSQRRKSSSLIKTTISGLALSSPCSHTDEISAESSKEISARDPHSSKHVCGQMGSTVLGSIHQPKKLWFRNCCQLHDESRYNCNDCELMEANETETDFFQGQHSKVSVAVGKNSQSHGCFCVFGLTHDWIILESTTCTSESASLSWGRHKAIVSVTG